MPPAATIDPCYSLLLDMLAELLLADERAHDTEPVQPEPEPAE